MIRWVVLSYHAKEERQWQSMHKTNVSPHFVEGRYKNPFSARLRMIHVSASAAFSGTLVGILCAQVEIETLIIRKSCQDIIMTRTPKTYLMIKHIVVNGFLQKMIYELQKEMFPLGVPLNNLCVV